MLSDVSSPTGRQALIIGGSIAGLLAGRVLAEHFEQVTIVERDRFPKQPVARKGIPQAQHLHVLLKRGEHILEQLFPGLTDELLMQGVPTFDAGADIQWLTAAGWGIRFDSGIKLLSFSRSLLDWHIRQRLLTFPNIRFLEARQVTGLLTNPEKTRVTGLALQAEEDSATDSSDCIQGDLIVDASGRSSKLPKWLAEIGYQPPQETVVNAFLGYASRVYRLPDTYPSDWKAYYVQAAPPQRVRTAIFCPIEGDRGILNLVGSVGDHPPTDEAGFLEFLRTSLPNSELYDLIKSSQPLSPIHSFRGTENRSRHYEQLAQWPEGLLALGDAVCSFNPTYGQGMTTSAIGALTLDECLREQRQLHANGDLTGLGQRFQQRLAKINELPWTLATTEDCRYPQAEGGRLDKVTQLFQWYIGRVIQLATHNPRVRLAFIEVTQMLKSPGILFHPQIVFQVLRQGLAG